MNLKSSGFVVWMMRVVFQEERMQVVEDRLRPGQDDRDWDVVRKTSASLSISCTFFCTKHYNPSQLTRLVLGSAIIENK